MYKDLRDWIEVVEGWGELKRVSGVDSHLEMGALVELVRKQNPNRPALLFDQIPGFDPGFRVVTGYFNSIRRLGLLTNLSPDLDDRAFIAALRSKIRNLEPIAPVEVMDGPVLENSMTGDAVDVTKFPAPLWHELDGGRYIGTGSVTITASPDGGPVNLGTYRLMVHDEKHIGLYMSPGRVGQVHMDAFFKRGEPLPIACSIGHDPVISAVGGLPLPRNLSEYDYAGGLKGAPIEVLRGPLTGLLIPARAEIVIEGEIRPGHVAEEGPFGEWTGYYASGTRPEPVITVKAIHYRNNPIINGAPPSTPPTDSGFMVSRFRSALLWNQMEQAGLPGVEAVNCHEVGSGFMLTIVAIKQGYPGHAKQAAALASQCQAGAYLNKMVIVVDEDINAYDLREVIWAVLTRCDPAESIDILRECWAGPLDPIAPPDRKGLNSRMLISACRPYSWKESFPPVIEISPELRKAVTERWGEALGFKL